jgi:WhiB family redox-sensing transcriptional regulator
MGAQEVRYPVAARDGDWSKLALCRNLPKELFCGTPWERDPDKKIREYKAKAICNTPCPVKQECLHEAIRNKEYGVWGGTTETERGRGRTRRKAN